MIFISLQNPIWRSFISKWRLNQLVSLFDSTGETDNGSIRIVFFGDDVTYAGWFYVALRNTVRAWSTLYTELLLIFLFVWRQILRTLSFYCFRWKRRKCTVARPRLSASRSPQWPLPTSSITPRYPPSTPTTPRPSRRNWQTRRSRWTPPTTSGMVSSNRSVTFGFSLQKEGRKPIFTLPCWYFTFTCSRVWAKN